MMFRTMFVLSLSLLLAYPALSADGLTSPDPYGAVYRIRATAQNRVADGSAVLITPGRLLTSCHVIRHASSIRVGREHLQWQAQLAMADIAHDLCMLKVVELSNAKPATIGATGSLRLGERVLALGYPRGGKLDATRGEIKGLHAYDGAHVIQVSASFDHGQSGGGLFDAAGELIGIIGFKAVAGGDYHYALPLAWAGDGISGQFPHPAVAEQADQPFWQRHHARKPLFLQAASLEANRDWPALLEVAQEWVDADSRNPAAWRCFGRILTKLKHDQAAAAAYAQAEALLPLVTGVLPPPSTPLSSTPITNTPITVAELEGTATLSDRPARQ